MRVTTRVVVAELAGVLLLVVGVPLTPRHAAAADHAWWEGEAPAETNFPNRSWYSPSTFKDNAHLLSEGTWLSISGTRGNGYATWMLGAALLKARALGLQGVLVTCDTDNLALARAIERNGGVFRDASLATADEKETARYWIGLRQGKEADRG